MIKAILSRLVGVGALIIDLYLVKVAMVEGVYTAAALLIVAAIGIILLVATPGEE